MRANSRPASAGSLGPAMARAGLAVLAVVAFVALLATRPAPGTPEYRAAGNVLARAAQQPTRAYPADPANRVTPADLARLAPAEPPFALRTEITDHANALGGDTAQVKASLDKLRSDSGVQLFVAYVDSFDGMRAQDWAHRAADLSNLGDNDVLLAVATGDRAYAYSVSGRFPLSDDQLASIANDDIEPALAKNDWSGAAIAAATGIGGAIGGGGSTGGTSGGTVFLWLLILAAVVVAVVLLIRYARKRTVRGSGPAGAGGGARGARAAEADELAALSTDELSTRANAMLVGTDDAIRASEEETGFAEAQYGTEATAPFRAAVEQARTELTAAFGVRQKLDDDEPDEAFRRSAYTTIIQHCTRANALLDEQSTAFERLRDLEAKLPEILPTLKERRTTLAGQVPATEAELARLTQTYASTALTQVTANIDQAQERLRFADENLALAEQQLAADKRGEAVIAARSAEEALGQAETLLGAVGSLGKDLAEASGRIEAMRAEITGEIAEARPHATGERAAEVTAAIAKAEAALASTASAAAATPSGETGTAATVATAAQSGDGDPLSHLRTLEEADETLDAALANVRDDQDRARKATQLLEQALLSARSQISAAQDFVATRRGAVGGEARTRLAEAARAYDQAMALSSTDPSQALEYARHADQLARDAAGRAQSDVADWESSRSGGVSAGTGGGGGGGAMSGMAGAMLGGILSNVLMGGGGGGGGRRGGFGGFGGMGGMGGMGGGSGGSGGGGRRGGGGRF